ncbi:lipopolysaccharide assembly protein LapA domain-containing protein [Marinagarivorans algicola]|uniref:lipopolysaccharide assembly protein LapA domain-containing protein n=1 Tax=Marinagarivorans algicola TaxID=1513270 RepID=UPI0006B47AC1|nr:lipopolysaccharide assembly protein LapA domain-containing protein [Marinagarivorans algicola]
MALLTVLGKWITRLLMVLWLLVLGLAVVHFVIENTSTVALTFYKWDFTAVPVPTLSLVLLGAGMLVAFLFLLPWLLLMQMKVQHLRKQVTRHQSALKSVAKVH